MNTEHTPFSYGEPWSHGGGAFIRSRHSATVALATGPFEERDRIIQCINACAGINDPSEALREAREALEEAQTKLEGWHAMYPGQTGGDDYAVVEAIESALAKLTPAI